MTEDRPKVPLYNTTYGDTVYWITFAVCLICLVGPVLAVLFPDSTAMNPYFTYALIFDGQTGTEIWTALYGEWPYMHSVWFKNFFTGDGITMFAMAIGCTVAVWALIPTIVAFVKEGLTGYAVFSVFIIAMILFAASGAVQIEVPVPEPVE